MDSQSPQSLARLNEAAPAFSALTTHGNKSLEEYRGRWLILFSHPADFTPVCTTKFIAFARRADAFKALNCARGLEIRRARDLNATSDRRNCGGPRWRGL